MLNLSKKAQKTLTEVVIGGEAAQATGYATGSALRTIGARAFKGCTKLTKVTFENTTGWKIYQYSTSTTGYEIDVSNEEINATNLRKTNYQSISSSATNWGRFYLKRSA